MASFSDFDIFGHFLNVSGIPQSDHYASKSAGYCLYIMLWDYNIIYMPMGSPQSEVLTGLRNLFNKFGPIGEQRNE